MSHENYYSPHPHYSEIYNSDLSRTAVISSRQLPEINTRRVTGRSSLFIDVNHSSQTKYKIKFQPQCDRNAKPLHYPPLNKLNKYECKRYFCGCTMGCFVYCATLFLLRYIVWCTALVFFDGRK